MKEYDMSIPEYVPCIYPQIHEQLKNKGNHIGIGFLVGFDFLHIPTFSVNFVTQYAEVSIWDGLKLKDELQDSDFVVRSDLVEYDELTKMDILDKFLEDGGSAILSGTTYHLPYSDDYLSDNYINDILESGKLRFGSHWLSVVAKKGDSYIIYDPIPNAFLGEVTSASLSNFWTGFKGIESLQDTVAICEQPSNGVLEINVVDEVDIKSIFNKLISIWLYSNNGEKMIIKNKTSFYYGKFALLKLREYYNRTVPIVSDVEERYQLWKCFFELKYNFIFFKMLLEEAFEFYKVDEMMNAISLVKQLIMVSESTANIIKMNQVRNRSENDIRITIDSELEKIISTYDKLQSSISELLIE